MNTILADIFKKGLFNVRVNGNSMYPILHDGDIVYFKKSKINQIKENEILLLYKSGRFFVHRLVYKTGKYLITKGDNNNYDDGRLSQKNVLGKAFFVKRRNYKFDIKHFYLAQSSLYFRQIEVVNGALKKNSIDFAFIKGLPINLYYFKKYSYRFFYDCDLLIPFHKKNQVINIMKKLKYKKMSVDLLKNEKKYWQESFYKIINGFPVVFDIHYRVSFLMTQITGLDCLYPLDFVDNLSRQIIKNRKFIKINTDSYPVISKMDLALLLLLHFFHHNYQEIYQLEKINKLITKLSPDELNRLIGLINYYQVNKFVYPCFYYLNKFFPSYQSKYLLKMFALENKNTMDLIRKMKLGPFNKKGRIEAGITRFKLLFYLSPQPIIKRVFIFVNPEVINLIYKILINKLRNFFNNLFTN